MLKVSNTSFLVTYKANLFLADVFDLVFGQTVFTVLLALVEFVCAKSRWPYH